MPQITLYTSKTSPYGHYVEIALREAKAEYTRFEVDLLNKPSWFTERVNRKGEIPAMTYGGPSTAAPDSPSPASHKLTESLVLLEFIADIFPSSGLLPRPTTDLAPVRRAQVRFFIALVSTKLGPAFSNALLRRGAPGDILAAIDELQPYMPSGGPGDGPFILGGAFSNADAVAAAYFVRVDGCLKRDIGSFPAGKGTETYEILCTSGQYARYRAYLSALVARESVKATFHEELLFAPNNVQYVLSKRAEK